MQMDISTILTTLDPDALAEALIAQLTGDDERTLDPAVQFRLTDALQCAANERRPVGHCTLSATEAGIEVVSLGSDCGVFFDDAAELKHWIAEEGAIIDEVVGDVDMALQWACKVATISDVPLFV